MRTWRGAGGGRQSWSRLAVVGVAVALAAPACSVSPGDKVNLSLRDGTMKVAPTTARSGRVQFEVDNHTTLTHNLVLIRKSDPSQIALTPEGAIDVKVDRPIDEIEDLGPGSYLAVSPNVLAGDYVWACTITQGPDGQPQNHFQMGMWAKMKVVPKRKVEPPAP
jgi:hypothetical protein